MMREVVQISSRAVTIPFSLAIFIPYFLQLTLMWLESPFGLSGCRKQELGQTQHQKAAEPEVGKIQPVLQGNYWILSASWSKCTGDFSVSWGPDDGKHDKGHVSKWATTSNNQNQHFLKSSLLNARLCHCDAHKYHYHIPCPKGWGYWNKATHRSLPWHWFVFWVQQLLDLPPPHWKDLTISLSRCYDIWISSVKAAVTLYQSRYLSYLGLLLKSS